MISLSKCAYSILWSGNTNSGDHLQIIQKGNLRELRVNHVWQGAYYLDSPLRLPTPYMQQMLLAVLYSHQVRRFLFVGLGTGSLPKVIHFLFPQAIIDVVEIDPVIVWAAQEYFNFPTEKNMVHLHIADGVNWILETKNHYDIVFLDAFIGDEMPKGFQSRSFMWQVKQALYPGGVLSINIPRHIFYDQQAILYNIKRYLGSPRLYDPVNFERHDDLNLIGISPIQELSSRTRSRKSLIKKHQAKLGIDIDTLLNNIYPRSTY